MTNKIKNLEKRIEALKQELLTIRDMRPGSLTEQYYKGDKKWPYWQISYTHKRKSKTEYVRDPFVKKIEEEIKQYKMYKQITEDWIDLSIELSKERIAEAKKLLKTEKI